MEISVARLPARHSMALSEQHWGWQPAGPRGYPCHPAPQPPTTRNPEWISDTVQRIAAQCVGAIARFRATPAILRSVSRMLEEIRQQPEALARPLSAELRSVEKFKRLVEKRRPRLVVLVARGTSDNAALFGRYLLEITTGIPVSLAAPSITTLYQARVDYRDALVVGISQSGESTDTNLVLERARRQGALTLGVTNESGSAMARIAEHVSLVRAGQMLMMY